MTARGPNPSPRGWVQSRNDVAWWLDGELIAGIAWVQIILPVGDSMDEPARHAFAVPVEKLHHLRTLMRLIESVVPELDAPHEVALVVVVTVDPTTDDTRNPQHVGIHQYIAAVFDNPDDTKTLAKLVSNAIVDGETKGEVITIDKNPLPPHVQ